MFIRSQQHVEDAQCYFSLYTLREDSGAVLETLFLKSLHWLRRISQMGKGAVICDWPIKDDTAGGLTANAPAQALDVPQVITAPS